MGMQQMLMGYQVKWFGKDKWNRGKQYFTIALAGEVGEMANLVKKEMRDGVDKTEEITEEIADIVIYSYLLAEGLGKDLDTMIDAKMKKNEAKFGAKK
jgi:NTP pyrophosphatase (non-canonical NTP hydrolase)